MNFYYGELSNFDLFNMSEKIQEEFFIRTCRDNVTEVFNTSQQQVIEALQEYGEIYFSFGKRVDDYLLCANNKHYKIDDNRSVNFEGIYMADAYFNKYEDINLGFLVSYNNGKIKILPAIEGESIGCRKYEVIEDCGDLNIEMKNFIKNYINIM